MTESTDPADAARAIVDEQRYMTLATADANGVPWASPVWFAHDGYASFLWVSKPGARHSRNIHERPEMSIVIFDSAAEVGSGQAVYLGATAAPIEDPGERAQAVEVYSRRSVAQGAAAWALDDVMGASRLRLYRAIVTESFILDAHDERIPVSLV